MIGESVNTTRKVRRGDRLLLKSVAPHARRGVVCALAPTTPLRTCGGTLYRGSRPSDTFSTASEGLGHAEGPPACYVVASGRVLSEGYRYGGLGVCLGDGQTEAEEIP